MVGRTESNPCPWDTLGSTVVMLATAAQREIHNHGSTWQGGPRSERDPRVFREQQKKKGTFFFSALHAISANTLVRLYIAFNSHHNSVTQRLLSQFYGEKCHHV